MGVWRMKKKLVIGIAVVTALSAVFLTVLRVRDNGAIKKPQKSTESVNLASTSSQADYRETVNGDEFNTDELDTGVKKESKSTAGLGAGAYDETEASTEASEPETYAETDADGKNLTEPAQTIPTVEQGLSASEYGQIAESIQQQNNAVITDTSSDGSIGKDVDDSVRALQEQDLENAKRAWASPEFQKYFESYHAND